MKIEYHPLLAQFSTIRETSGSGRRRCSNSVSVGIRLTGRERIPLMVSMYGLAQRTLPFAINATHSTPYHERNRPILMRVYLFHRQTVHEAAIFSFVGCHVAFYLFPRIHLVIRVPTNSHFMSAN